MTNKIEIPFSDEQARDIIQIWLDGPCGRVWCERVDRCTAHKGRYILKFTQDGADEYLKTHDFLIAELGATVIRRAIAEMLTQTESPGNRRYASDALLGIEYVDNPCADAIVQQAIFGRVVFG